MSLPFILFLLVCVAFGVFVLHGGLNTRKTHVPTPPAPSKPAPEFSCFIKGVILSMKETPELWTWDKGEYVAGYYSGYTKYLWTHSLSGLIIAYNNSRHGFISFPQDHPSNAVEDNAICDAVKTYLEPLRTQHKDAEAKRIRAEELAKTAHIRAPFERLACPPNSSDMSTV
jgi:hypothetical protein